MNKYLSSFLAFLAVSTLAACSDDSPPKPGNSGGGGGHSHKGAHGGSLVELGDVAHLEFIRNEGTGKATLYITGPDGKAALPIADAPEIKLATDDGQKVLGTNPVNGADGKSSEFTATDDALKAHELAGRVSVKVDGKLYNPEINVEHDYEHK